MAWICVCKVLELCHGQNIKALAGYKPKSAQNAKNAQNLAGIAIFGG